MYATIEYARGGNTIQRRLVSNDPACIHQAFHLKNYGKTIWYYIDLGIDREISYNLRLAVKTAGILYQHDRI
ncbi:MAG TPA: hypothetical protein VFJ51_08990 [Nitrososphaeraceae archaeon]|nr:hypothetical protein [Nitrososphaeraceae archaeon]